MSHEVNIIYVSDLCNKALPLHHWIPRFVLIYWTNARRYHSAEREIPCAQGVDTASTHPSTRTGSSMLQWINAR